MRDVASMQVVKFKF